LITVQRALAAGSTPELLAAEQALFTAHDKVLLGDLRKGREAAQVCSIDWKNGYWSRVKVASNWDTEDDDANKVLGMVQRHPTTLFLEALEIGLLDVDGEAYFEEAVNILVRHGKRPGLRRLHLGAFEYPDDTEISWSYHSNVERLGPLLPDLETFRITGGGIDLGALKLPSLQTLVLETGGLPAQPVEHLANASFPNLETLEIWFGNDDYGAACSADHVAALLANTQGLPAVRTLGLKNAQIANDINGVLANAPLLAQLTSLDLSMGVMTDAGAEALLAAMPSLVHLQELDVSENFLSEAMEQRLAAAFPGELTTGSDKEDDGDWYYTTVGE
jgi:hypothetical protein